MSLKEQIFPRLNYKSEANILPALSEGTKIPKIIHQTYHSKSLPPEIEKNIVEIKNLNPGWEYRLYDDDDITQFIKIHYGDRIFDFFKRVNSTYGSAKADLFRYLLMYKIGGIYLDIKSSLTKPLDEVLNAEDRYLLSNWRNQKGEEFEGWGLHPALGDISNGEFQQWYIAAAPGHPFVKAVIENVLANIDRYNPAIHGVGKSGVLVLTGPVAYTLAIFPLLKSCKYRFVDSESDIGLKYSIYTNQSHKAIFKSHYTNLTTSIVEIDGAKKMYAQILTALKATRNVIRARIP